MRATRRSLSVLLVDDERHVLDCYGRYLEAAGLKVLRAENARDAIIFAVHGQPDVIVLDLVMPGLDGYAVLNALKCVKTTAQIPVVIFTGTIVEETGRPPQVRACVQKPATPRELLNVVRMFVSRA